MLAKAIPKLIVYNRNRYKKSLTKKNNKENISMEDFTEPCPKDLRGFALEGEDQPIKEGE